MIKIINNFKILYLFIKNTSKVKMFLLFLLQGLVLFFTVQFLRNATLVNLEKIDTVFFQIFLYVCIVISGFIESFLRHYLSHESSYNLHLRLLNDKKKYLYHSKNMKLNFFSNILNSAILFSQFIVIPFYLFVCFFCITFLVSFLSINIIIFMFILFMLYILIFYFFTKILLYKIRNHEFFKKEIVDKIVNCNYFSVDIKPQRNFFVSSRINSEKIGCINIIFFCIFAIGIFVFLKYDISTFSDSSNLTSFFLTSIILFRSFNYLSKAFGTFIRYIKQLVFVEIFI